MNDEILLWDAGWSAMAFDNGHPKRKPPKLREIAMK